MAAPRNQRWASQAIFCTMRLGWGRCACAYLVRFWQDYPNDNWRASAQSAQRGETVRFADLEQLFAFLRAHTAGQSLQEAQHNQA